MEHANNLQARRLAGTLTLVGSLCMLGGAAVWGSTGVDMDQALDTGDLVGYLDSRGLWTQFAKITLGDLRTVVDDEVRSRHCGEQTEKYQQHPDEAAQNAKPGR